MRRGSPTLLIHVQAFESVTSKDEQRTQSTSDDCTTPMPQSIEHEYTPEEEALVAVHACWYKVAIFFFLKSFLFFNKVFALF